MELIFAEKCFPTHFLYTSWQDYMWKSWNTTTCIYLILDLRTHNIISLCLHYLSYVIFFISDWCFVCFISCTQVWYPWEIIINVCMWLHTLYYVANLRSSRAYNVHCCILSYSYHIGAKQHRVGGWSGQSIIKKSWLISSNWIVFLATEEKLSPTIDNTSLDYFCMHALCITVFVLI